MEQSRDIQSAGYRAVSLDQKVKDDLSKIDNSSIDKDKIKKIKYFSATSDIEPKDIQAIQNLLKKKNIDFEFVSNYD